MRFKQGILSILAAGLVLLAPVPSAQALLLGAGQTATFDFDFGTLAPATQQPLAFTFEITTASPTSLSDPAGFFFFQFLGIGADTPITLAYDGSSGGYNPSPVLVVVDTTDIVGTLTVGALTESFDLTGLSLSINDGFGSPVVGLTSLALPEAPDFQIPEPGPLATLIMGLAALAGARKLRRA